MCPRPHPLAAACHAAIAAVLCLSFAVGCGDSSSTPTVKAANSEAAGKYIVSVAGCNDCHTPGWMEKGQAVPESDWLVGIPIGWRGPWGTTYASNLRLYVRDMNEDEFVKIMRTRTTRPPMNWPAMHLLSERDLRAVYKYIRNLPAKGERMPAWVPPDRQPSTAWISMEPVMPKTPAAPPAGN